MAASELHRVGKMGQYTQQIGTTARKRLNNPQDEGGEGRICCESREGRDSEPLFTEGTGLPGQSSQPPACPHPGESGASSDLSLITA